jgi:hypothetical protein
MFARIRQRLPADPGLLTILVLLIAWSAWFIARTSYTVDGQRYFCLFDDAMISMTYARNWVAGYGLVWARHGGPVEGFTHPLWTLGMALLHLLPIPPRLQSLPVQLLSLGFLCANVVAVHHLVRRHFSAGAFEIALPAAILTAIYYPLNHWALQGMETGLVALLVTLAVRYGLDIVRRHERRELALCSVLALGLLLRLDLAILAGVVLGFVALHGGFAAGSRKGWAPGLSLLIAAPLAYEVFRVAYFGEWLPNTYFLKLTGVDLGVRVLRGATVFVDFLAVAGAPLALVAIGVIPLLRGHIALRLPFALVLAFFSYSVYTGGDAWDKTHLAANRFEAIAMPMVFVMLGALFNIGLEGYRRWAEAHQGLRFSSFYVVAPVTLACALLVNGLWAADRSARRWADVLITERPFNAEKRARITGEIQALASFVSPDAKVATVWAGVPAYFSAFRMIDTLGYNDRHVARLGAANGVDLDSSSYFWPGHIKWDYEWTYGVMQPDVVFQTWPPSGKGVPERMHEYGFVPRRGVWVRPDSPRVQ